MTKEGRGRKSPYAPPHPFHVQCRCTHEYIFGNMLTSGFAAPGRPSKRLMRRMRWRKRWSWVSRLWRRAGAQA